MHSLCFLFSIISITRNPLLVNVYNKNQFRSIARLARYNFLQNETELQKKKIFYHLVMYLSTNSFVFSRLLHFTLIFYRQHQVFYISKRIWGLITGTSPT